VLTNPAQAEFIYGECFCPILEDPEEDSVANDREKLIRNERTDALLDWIRQKVGELNGRNGRAERTRAKGAGSQELVAVQPSSQ